MNYLISIVGATGIGKSGWAVRLAQHLGCEIISCDSRQFYREMSIGTAVPSQEELQSVNHHFIQHLSIHDVYSVGQFEKDVLLKLTELFTKNKIVIMVGGSGLFVDAVLSGLDDFPDINPELRQSLNLELETKGLAFMQQKLLELDPESYQTIALDNPHRVLRAIEVTRQTGRKFSSFKLKEKNNRNFTSIPIGFDAPREIIYQRIEKRVDKMIADGLVEEARQLKIYKNLNALQTVGYKELFDYFEGKISLEKAVELIKQHTRNYAKRQNTWFKRNPELQWFDYLTPENEVLQYIISKIGQ